MKYKGYFKYKEEKTPIVINNDGEYLSFEIHGVRFKGGGFTDFTLQGEISDEMENKYDYIRYCDNGKVIYDLCNCAFDVESYLKQ